MNYTFAGVSTVSSRLQELTLRFHAKFQSLHPDNPVHALKDSICSAAYPPRVQRKILSPHLPLPLTALHRECILLSNTRPPWDPLTFSEFFRICKLQSYAAAKNILPRSILPEARDKTLVDISLRIRNPRIQSYAIRWRLNRLLAHYKCKCDEKLTRGHVTRCYDFGHLPQIQLLPSLPSPLPSPHYSYVDHALN